jgi:hypothetical protein
MQNGHARDSIERRWVVGSCIPDNQLAPPGHYHVWMVHVEGLPRTGDDPHWHKWLLFDPCFDIVLVKHNRCSRGDDLTPS